jgi:hypothetical protein
MNVHHVGDWLGPGCVWQCRLSRRNYTTAGGYTDRVPRRAGAVGDGGRTSRTRRRKEARDPRDGSEVLADKRERDTSPVDLLVWSDVLVSELGGPLIVECKFYGGGTGSVLMNARQTLAGLAGYVGTSSAKLGLLIFDHNRPNNQPCCI